MATIQQLVGRWRLVESKGFDEYMKEVGVGMALRKVGAMAKPDCIITSDGKTLSIKTESTLKTTQFSCKLGEKFEETTADGRKTQTVCNFTDGALVQHQEWDGKESTITRKLEDGKLVVIANINGSHLESFCRHWAKTMYVILIAILGEVSTIISFAIVNERVGFIDAIALCCSPTWLLSTGNVLRCADSKSGVMMTELDGEWSLLRFLGPRRKIVYISVLASQCSGKSFRIQWQSKQQRVEPSAHSDSEKALPLWQEFKHEDAGTDSTLLFCSNGSVTEKGDKAEYEQRHLLAISLGLNDVFKMKPRNGILSGVCNLVEPVALVNP
ncbi:hypothetical protein MJT46_009248 [Ovis ammon polii x Ovis aries]|nr:hypothetical protein MJT46_009248 [Ovis ammon polii x Ovis aries]